MCVRKVVGAVRIALLTGVASRDERISDAYETGQCFVQLSSSNRVRPVPLLVSDKFSSLQGDQVRQASSVGEDLDRSLSFAQAIEMRFKRMAEENDKRIQILEEQNDKKIQKLTEENRKQIQRLDSENSNLRQRLAAIENSKEQEPGDPGAQDVESNLSSFELVKVDGIKLGVCPLVLYTIARECVTEDEGNSNGDRSATRRHREQYCSLYPWEWWARVAVFSMLLQGGMIVILRYGMTIIVPASEHAGLVPAWQFSIAAIVSLYDAYHTILPGLIRAGYCYWKMDSLELFRRHKNPKRARVCAAILGGWEILIFVAIITHGLSLLRFSQSPIDLILNGVAVHFLHEIDDYLVRLAPILGLQGDIDLPKCIIMPTYITEPQWRDDFFFYAFAKFYQYTLLDTPIWSVLLTVLFFLATDVLIELYKEDPRQLEHVYAGGLHHFLLAFLYLSFMAVLSVMAVWNHCARSVHNNSVHGGVVIFAKVVCFLLVYFVTVGFASVSLSSFMTDKLELSMFVPDFICVGICWSCFMALVILIIH